MKRLAVSAASLVLAGAGFFGAAGPGVASTAHCPGYNTEDKVELDYETTTLSFAPGTTVCYKSGTQVFTVVVGPSGVLTSQALNKAGRPMGISYYIVVDEPTYPPQS